MFWQTCIPAFVLGLASSFHCIGMCGPIVLLLPTKQLSARQKPAGIILYNLGRISTYVLLGILFGYIGRRFFLAGYQQLFSIMLGATIIAASLFYMVYSRFSSNYISKIIIQSVRRSIQVLMDKKGFSTLYLIGVVNGFLPCGMVYFAILGAMASGTVPGSALFMACFGLGTLPLMLSLNWFAGLAGIKTRRLVKNLVPYMICLMGTLLILRGLNLNIPYISPHIAKDHVDIITCH